MCIQNNKKQQNKEKETKNRHNATKNRHKTTTKRQATIISEAFVLLNLSTSKPAIVLYLG